MMDEMMIIFDLSIKEPAMANKLPIRQVISHAHTLQSSDARTLSSAVVLNVSNTEMHRLPIVSRMAKLRSLIMDAGMGLSEIVLEIRDPKMHIGVLSRTLLSLPASSGC